MHCPTNARFRRCRAMSRLAAGLLLALLGRGEPALGQTPEHRIGLPAARLSGPMSLEQALQQRRSVREFADVPLRLEAAAQVLWAAQGITAPSGYRSAPSAGALYPLQLYLVAGRVSGLAAGVYRYRPASHDLELISDGDLRDALAAAALGQRWMADAPAVVAIAGIIGKTRAKYGRRAARYLHMETGHAAQNIYLQATASGLGTVMVGAFHDAEVKQLLRLPAQQAPLALLPLGSPRQAFAASTSPRDR